MPDSESLAAFSKRSDLERFGANALGVFALQLRFGAEDAGLFADSITDGVGDRKCDLVHIDEDFGVVVVAQVYVAADPTKSTPPLNKASDLHTAASWILDPDHAGSMPGDLLSAAGQLRAAIEDADVDAIEFWYVHNLLESKDASVELQKVAKTADALLKSVYGDMATGINCRGMQIGRSVLDDLYARRAQRILIEDEIQVPAQRWISQSGEKWNAVCTSVPGSWLRELHQQYGADKLFSGNVRDYLGRKRSTQNINYTIEQTALERPRDFWAFNNGVTAVVREIVEEGADKLSVRGITIVNGAQTTGALANAKVEKDVMVLTRFVQSSDPDVVESIIRANNTQNEIRASDFRSMDAQQRRLREEFIHLPGVHYAGARRGVLAAPDTAAAYITADQAAQTLAAFHDEPQRAYHGKSKIWEDDALYARFFSERTTAVHIVYVACLYWAVAGYKRRLREKADRTASEAGILDFLSQRGAAFLLMAAIGRCQENILERSIPDRFALSFGEEVSPETAEGLWTPVVVSLASFHSLLGEAAQSGKIRSLDVRTTAMDAFQAAVQSLQEHLSGTVFRKFSPHVILT